ncbi:MAG: hypothetical protein M1839_006576 [Geoglossum umbratile]|nr:MAG: hypothetical protein M1839_006576 [Geoglossum umbratile]
MASTITAVPFGRVTESELGQLSQVLWSWPLCEGCRVGDGCEMAGCPSQRSKRLLRFFEHYKDSTASYEPDVASDEQPALCTHRGLFEIIQILKSQQDLTRAQLIDKLFHDRPGRKPSPPADKERAIDLAVGIMTMIHCSAQRQSSSILEHGIYRTSWRSDVTFSQFITHLFPMTDHPSLNDDSERLSSDMKRALTARKLIKRSGLKFRPTDDLRSHLKLDRKNDIVEIFHHTAFLKEHLRLTKDKPRNMSVSDSLKLQVKPLHQPMLSILVIWVNEYTSTISGALPRQLVLETLDSIQKILFPLSDPKSRSLLLSLTSTSSFDPDSLRFESASIRTAEEKDIKYHYFGGRLVDLHEELENPKPRGWIGKWLERRSGARYVMLATLTGVLIAVSLGIASLAVGIYQAWLGYQQWQHPKGSGRG